MRPPRARPGDASTSSARTALRTTSPTGSASRTGHSKTAPLQKEVQGRVMAWPRLQRPGDHQADPPAPETLPQPGLHGQTEPPTSAAGEKQTVDLPQDRQEAEVSAADSPRLQRPGDHQADPPAPFPQGVQTEKPVSALDGKNKTGPTNSPARQEESAAGVCVQSLN